MMPTKCRKILLFLILLLFMYQILFNLIDISEDDNTDDTDDMDFFPNNNQAFKFNNSLLTKQNITGFNDKLKYYPFLPNEINGDKSDRIINQLRVIPPGYTNKSLKKIIIYEYNTLLSLPIELVDPFKYCPVSNCVMELGKSVPNKKADLVIFITRESIDKYSKLSNPIRLAYCLESPFTQYIDPNSVHGVLSYHYNSLIVAPYFKMARIDESVPIDNKLFNPLAENYHRGRKYDAIVFISNCKEKNARLTLVKHLRNFINVSFYGKCGDLKCSKRSPNCWQLMSEHWFYLAFENCNCRHYITEKLFRNAFQHDIVPIVYGAPKADYDLVAPAHSYIHLESYKNIRELTNYLRYLQSNFTAYNEYFAWKKFYKIDVNTHTWCRVCSFAHYINKFSYKLITDDAKYYFSRIPYGCRANFWTNSSYQKFLGMVKE